MSKLRIGMVGARGHVGSELVRLVAARSDVDIAWMTSSGRAGASAREEIEAAPADLRLSAPDPKERLRDPVDVVILALPNGESGPWTRAIAELAPEVVVVDLGSDHRFDARFTYGLPSRHRGQIRTSKRIANPGCYATALQIALDPLVSHMFGPAVAFGVSGYSGAGAAPSPRNDVEQLRDNVMPYGLVDHVHEREVTRELDHPIRFLPHVAPFFRGLSVTISGRLDHETSRSEIIDRLAARYEREPLVRLVEDAPLVREVVGRHEVFVGGVSVARDGRAFAMVATVDNLLGGAATTALRNVNLATGREELAGIAT